MSTITFVIVINAVLCVAILAGQLWHYGRVLRTPKGDRGIAARRAPRTEQPPSS